MSGRLRPNSRAIEASSNGPASRTSLIATLAVLSAATHFLDQSCEPPVPDICPKISGLVSNNAVAVVLASVQATPSPISKC